MKHNINNMKKVFILTVLIFFSALTFGQSLSLINLGTAPNNGTGDPARTAFSKTNAGLTQMNRIGILNITATSAEINLLHGVTTTTAQFNYLSDVTSPIGAALNGKQATLLSGVNIKNINSVSVLGAGNMVIGSGGTMVYPGTGISLSNGTGWATSITNNSANWNTAYGWGNHASAGYALNSALSSYVPTTRTVNSHALSSNVTITASDIGAVAVSDSSAMLTKYAHKASPAFTGVPTAPTAAVSTNTTQVATTAFVIANGGTDAGLTVRVDSIVTALKDTLSTDPVLISDSTIKYVTPSQLRSLVHPATAGMTADTIVAYHNGGLYYIYNNANGYPTYYVDQVNGNDSWTGLSPATAWKTISKINGLTILPGTKILLNRGNIWRETLTVPSSGSPNNPITIGAYGTGARPIIQRTAQATSWTQVGSTNVYYATYANNPWGVYINDVYVQPAHWPTTAGAATPTFEYPSDNSANNTHVTDATLTGKSTGQLAGTQVNMYTNNYTQAQGLVSAFDGTSIMTCASLGTTPLTTFRYYLTAPAGTGYAYANKAWMMSENTWFYDTDATRLYVWATGGGSPGTVEVSDKSSQDILINGKSYITLENLNTRYSYYGITALATAVNGVGIVVKNCKLQYHDHDALKGQATGAYSIACTFIDNYISYSSIVGLYLIQHGESLVQNDTVVYSGGYPLLPGKSYAMLLTANANDGTKATVNSNHISYSTFDGIANTSVYHNIITNNYVDHTNSLLVDGGAIYFVGSNITASGNTITGCSGTGVYNDETSSSCTIELNNITGGTYGIELNKASNDIVRRNTLTGPFTGYWAAGGMMLSSTSASNDIYYNIINGVNKSGHGIHADPAVNNLNNIYNNLIMNCDIGLSPHANTSGAYGSVKNNIFYNNNTHIQSWSGDISAIDYNDFYGTGNWIWGGTSESTFSLWKTASSGDSHSINADPLFTSGSDFSLQTGSPCINTGATIAGIPQFDFLYNPMNGATDIGAYEKQ